MKLHHLRYFSVLAEELHFGRAAARLAITQPPLSGAIKALEEELGTPLFLRDNKRVQLTPAGAALRAESQHILARIDRAAEVTRAFAAGQRGRLDVGIAGSLVYREPSAIVHRFNRTHPGVEVVLHELSSAQQVEELLRGELDAGFVNASTVPPPLTCRPLADDHFVCCLPADHPMSRHKTVRLQDMALERFVMFARDVAPANHDNVLAVFNRAGIQPRLTHAARQWLTVIAMVSLGFGIALVPQSLARSRIAGVVFVPLARLPAHTRALLAWQPQPTNLALASFLEAARHILDAPAPVGGSPRSRSKRGMLG